MNRKFLGGGLVLAIHACTSLAQVSSTTLAFADSLMKMYYPATGPGAVLLIAQAGQSVFQKAYGMASLELQVATQPTQVFAVGSITKQVTTVAILQLAQQGRLALSDPITKYLPNFPTYGQPVTIDHLLSHTGGLPNLINIRSVQQRNGKKQGVVYDMNTPLLFKPGTAWSYSNLGYYLLGLIIQQASGLSYEDYLQAHIFTPLGMNHTYFGTHERILPELVSGYDPVGNNGFKPTAAQDWSKAYSAGGLVSSVADLLTWDEALYGTKLLSQTQLRKAFTSYPLPMGRTAHYGYGWAIDSLHGAALIHHGGEIGGYLSDAIRIPSQHLFVVLLSNATKVSPDRLTTPIALRLANFSLTPPPTKPVNAAKLRGYTGVYQVVRGLHADQMEKTYLELKIKQDTLRLSQNGSELSLFYTGSDQFYSQYGNTKVFFHRNAQGQISTIDISPIPFGFGPPKRAQKTNLPFQTPREMVVPDVNQLQPIVGDYTLSSGDQARITLEEGHFYAEVVGLGKYELLPKSKTTFMVKGGDASLLFVFDKAGRVTGFTLLQSGTQLKAKKMS